MNKCLNCNTLTKNLKFCSSSCSAIVNNKNRNGCLNRNGLKECSCIICENIILVNIRHSPKTVKCEICKGKCKYCRKQARFKLINGSLCCSKSMNSCPAIKNEDSKALIQLYIEEGKEKNSMGAIDKYEMKYAKKLEEIYDINNPISDSGLCELNRVSIKNIIILERGYQCERCENSKWLDYPITLELEHIDGNGKNNSRNNLKLLCPNCHSLTKTWRRRKAKGNRLKHDIDIYIDAIQSSYNMNQCLNKLDLAWGSNITIKNIMKKYRINFKDKTVSNKPK